MGVTVAKPWYRSVMSGLRLVVTVKGRESFPDLHTLVLLPAVGSDNATGGDARAFIHSCRRLHGHTQLLHYTGGCPASPKLF